MGKFRVWYLNGLFAMGRYFTVGLLLCFALYLMELIKSCPWPFSKEQVNIAELMDKEPIFVLFYWSVVFVYVPIAFYVISQATNQLNRPLCNDKKPE